MTPAANNGTDALERPGSLERAGIEVALSTSSQAVLRLWAGTYRSFCAWLDTVRGGEAPADFSVAELAAYRDFLRAQKLDLQTIAQRLSALRRLARYMELDPAIQRLRAEPMVGPSAPCPGSR